MLTVTVPAESNDLTTLAAVKAELGVTGGGDDAKLAGYIKQASDTVTSYCNRVFAIETVSETLRLDQRRDELILSRFPVTALASIVENGVTLASTDYELDGDTGVIRRLRDDGPWSWPQGKIVVAYAAGYILPGAIGRNLPQDIERAVILLVGRYASITPQDQLLRRETVEGIGSTEVFQLGSSGLPPEVTALLTNYRMPAIG
jgi:uncharacterized phiE125 gp8 family phage protein